MTTTTSTDVLLGAVSTIVKERDNARKALEAALLKIDELELEIGETRTTSRLASIFDDFAPTSYTKNQNIATEAWSSCADSLKRISAIPVPKTFPNISNKHVSPPAKARTEEPLRCSRCLHKGHVDSECRFHFQCSRCKIYGHTVDTCRIPLHIHCSHCNAYGHTEDRCFSKIGLADH